jgi:hypothetical protein
VALGIDSYIPDPYQSQSGGVRHITSTQDKIFRTISIISGFEISEMYSLSQEDIFTALTKLSREVVYSLLSQAQHHSSLRSGALSKRRKQMSTASHPSDGASHTCSSEPSSVNSMSEDRDVPGQHGLSGQGPSVAISSHGAISSSNSLSSSSLGPVSNFSAMRASGHVPGPPQQVFGASNVDYSQHGQFEVRVGPTNKAHLVFIGKAHYDAQPSGHHCVETPLPHAANRLDALRLSSGVQVRNMLRKEERARGCGIEASQSSEICQYLEWFLHHFAGLNSGVEIFQGDLLTAGEVSFRSIRSIMSTSLNHTDQDGDSHEQGKFCF